MDASRAARVPRYLLERLSEVDGLTLHGPLRRRVASFSADFAHPHDVAEILGRRDVCIRAGHHCAQVLMQRARRPRHLARERLRAHHP